MVPLPHTTDPSRLYGYWLLLAVDTIREVVVAMVAVAAVTVSLAGAAAAAGAAVAVDC
jgi:hypothetical protein